jgi:outer membrane protein TolC
LIRNIHLFAMAFVSASSLVSVNTAHADEATFLSADEVARRAQSTSFEVAARSDERAAAQAAVDQALASYLPRLSGSLRYTRLSNVPASSLGNVVLAPTAMPGSVPDPTRTVAVPMEFASISNQYAAQATLQIPLSDYLVRLPQTHESAKDSARASALSERATRLRVAAEARAAYYQWWRARLQVAVAEKAVAQARGHLQDVKHAVDVQAASNADVLRVESQVAAAELLLVRTRNAVVISETQLRTLMHDDSTKSYDSREDLSAEPPAELAEGQAMPTLWDEAGRQRLELQALDEEARAVEQQAQVALVPGMPRLDLVGNATYADPNQRIFPQTDRFRGTWDATIQLSWSPTDLPGSLATRRSAKARARQITDQRAAALDGIKMEVTQAAQALGEARVAVATAQRGQQAAEESCRVRQVLFQNGRATSVELTDAETELTRARMDLVAAQIDRHLAAIRLRHALGRDVN